MAKEGVGQDESVKGKTEKREMRVGTRGETDRQRERKHTLVVNNLFKYNSAMADLSCLESSSSFFT